MRRSVFGGLVLAVCAFPVVAGTPDPAVNSRSLPMQFSLQRETPAESCGAKCRVWVFASGMITANTPRQFEAFASDHDVRGATMVLDSDGGSVHGALALGRAIRRLGLSTTVGRRADPRSDGSTDKSDKTAATDKADQPSGPIARADCESMCAFVLLGGVRRIVPTDSRVMVHQIWLGDRRDDANAASYSAEDLVLVQRDIGKLVEYTAEMGGGVELLELALRIPPWEPMRTLSRDELKRANLDMAREVADQPLNSATSTVIPVSNGNPPATISDRAWATLDRSGRVQVVRRHPLTVEGERIGSFDLTLACADAGNISVSYTEWRSGPSSDGPPRFLKDVRLWVNGSELPLKVVSSEVRGAPRQLETVANAAVPVAVMRALADGSRSVTIVTRSSGNPPTTIRLGNTGYARSFGQLETACGSRLRRDAHAQLDQAQQ